MRDRIRRIVSVLCVFALLSATAQAHDSVLTAIPSDALGFAVVHNAVDASHSVSELAKLVQAPAPDLLNLAKNATGIQAGVDDQGDLAVVLTAVDPSPKVVVLIPVANFADFFGALKISDPAGVVEVSLNGKSKLIGRKGNFAALANPDDRDALEGLLAANTNLAADTSLATWIDANKISVVVPSRGLSQLLPKLTGAIRTAQAGLRQVPGQQGQTGADALNMYVALFTAAQTEVDQFALGLRIDSAQTIDLVKRVQLKPGGTWAKWAADVKPTSENMLAGLPTGPFIAVGGGIIPPGAMEQMMKFSVQMMQSNPAFNMTPDQAARYLQLTTASLRHVRSMRMWFGIAEPGAGIYGNTTGILNVDDSKAYIADYEKNLTQLREFANEVKSPFIPIPDVQRSKLGDIEVFEITMDMLAVAQATQPVAPGAPDPQQMMKMFAGPDGKMKIYVAPADDHNVIMAYTSLDNLKAALETFKSKQPGIAAEPGVAKVSAILPQDSQMVAYISINGVTKAIQQFLASMPNAPPVTIPELAASPPIGMAAKVSPIGVEGHLVVTADTLRTIGDAVAKMRQGMGRPPAPPQ